MTTKKNKNGNLTNAWMFNHTKNPSSSSMSSGIVDIWDGIGKSYTFVFHFGKFIFAKKFHAKWENETLYPAGVSFILLWEIKTNISYVFMTNIPRLTMLMFFNLEKHSDCSKVMWIKLIKHQRLHVHLSTYKLKDEKMRD